MKHRYRLSHIIKSFLFIIFIFAFGSCVIKKPDSNSVSKPDYNHRVKVTNPVNKGVLSPVGYGSIAASAIAGGYVGYTSEVFPYYSDGELKSFDIGGAILGAGLGFTASYFLNKGLGWGKTYQVKDPNRWVNKANKNYILLGVEQNNFLLINKDIEPNYMIKNRNDIADFSKAFPSSLYTNHVFLGAIENCKREDFPTLIQTFPGSIHVEKAKIKYITTASNYRDIKSSHRIYPDLQYDFEKYYINLIQNIPDALDFRVTYPKSERNRVALCHAFRSEARSRTEITRLANAYSAEFLLGRETLALHANNNIKRNYLNALFLLERPSDLFEVDDFYNLYGWINYPNKGMDVMEKYWDIGIKTFPNGDIVLGSLFSLEGRFQIKRNTIQSFTQKKLEEELKKNVTITRRVLESKNEQWEAWLNNNTYAAGLVAQQEDVKYLVYGEIRNNSIFNIPVEIEAKGDLFARVDVQGTGFWTNLSVGIAKLFANAQGQSLNNERFVASSTNNFIIPNLPANSVGTYAVLLDFRSDLGNAGVNLADLYKITNTVHLKNNSVSVKYGKTQLSQAKRRNQQAWQEMAVHGLPQTRLTDLWRGEEVEDEAWKQKWDDILERRRQAALEYQAQQAAVKESGVCYTLTDTNVKIEHYSNKTVQGIRIRCLGPLEPVYTLFYLDQTTRTGGGSNDYPGWYSYDGIIFKSPSRVGSAKSSFEEVAKRVCRCYY